jgi:hypothetical protein
LSIFAPHDTDRRMGRPPLKLKDPTVKTTIRLPTSLLRRLKAAAGDGDSAALIRVAIERELDRRGHPPSPEVEDA